MNTRLLVKTLHNMTLIPTSAIQHNGDTAFVYLIQNGNVRRYAMSSRAWRMEP